MVKMEPMAIVQPDGCGRRSQSTRGIQRSILRVSGHGAASRWPVTARESIVQSKRKNKRLITGKKKSTTSQSGCPRPQALHRQRHTSQMKGNAKPATLPQTCANPDKWHSRAHPVQAAASSSTRTTSAQTPRRPQLCREDISGQTPRNLQWHRICDRSFPATATSRQNGSPQNLLTARRRKKPPRNFVSRRSSDTFAKNFHHSGDFRDPQQRTAPPDFARQRHCGIRSAVPASVAQEELHLTH